MMGFDIMRNCSNTRVKNKHWIFAILAVLIVLTAQPMVSAAERPGFLDTDITAVVQPIYEFALPPNVTVRYPNTRAVIGQFAVNDLLLYSGEQLAIEIVPGSMDARGTGSALPYTVAFNPPAAVDAANIGEAYDVVVTIDAAAFAATRRPYHDADLLFRVRSQLTNEVIWQGTTTVTARKTPTGGGGGPGTGDGDGEGIPDMGDNTIPGEEVPQAGPDTEGDAQPGTNIPAEEIPEAQPASASWWWIPAAVLGVVLLLMLSLLLLWRNVTVMVFGLDRLGQEELLRTIHRLSRKRNEVFVALSGKQVRGGVSGMVELSEALTKRMKGKAITIEVDGHRIFSTIIPADIDGGFRTGFDGWME